MKFCDGHHTAFSAISLIPKSRNKEAEMRKALCAVVVGVLFTACVVDIVAAAVKSGAAKSHFYRATPTAITIAVPASMKSFPTEVLPQ